MNNNIIKTPCAYNVITLCGSTKFKDEFIEANKKLTLAGNVVISVGVFGHSDNEPITLEQKIMLDMMHKQKIDMSNEIHVINKNGYVGDSTKSEINYAHKHNKKVTYMFPEFVEEKPQQSPFKISRSCEESLERDGGYIKFGEDIDIERCGHCGSMNPYQLEKFFQEGRILKVESADWKYGYPHKFYITIKDRNNRCFKFYTNHLGTDFIKRKDKSVFNSLTMFLFNKTGIIFSQSDNGRLMYRKINNNVE